MGLMIKPQNNDGIIITCKCGEVIEIRWRKDLNDGVCIEADRDIKVSRIDKPKVSLPSDASKLPLLR
jgi:hypothetical protein